MTVKEIKLLYSDEYILGDGKTSPYRTVYRFYTHDGKLIFQIAINQEYNKDNIINYNNIEYLLGNIGRQGGN